MLRLGITASAGLLHPHGVVGEHEESLTDQHLALGQVEIFVDDTNPTND
jgi:hypothetical protein